MHTLTLNQTLLFFKFALHASLLFWGTCLSVISTRLLHVPPLSLLCCCCVSAEAMVTCFVRIMNRALNPCVSETHTSAYRSVMHWLRLPSTDRCSDSLKQEGRTGLLHSIIYWFRSRFEVSGVATHAHMCTRTWAAGLAIPLITSL